MTVPLPSRAPAPHPTRRLLGRVALRNCLVVAAALVLLVVLVAGCGQTPLPAAAPSTIAPTTPAPPSPPAAPPTSGITATPEAGGGDTTAERRTGAPAPQGAAPRAGDGAARAGAPIWPATDTTSARRLQQSVDGGQQPWLLDPAEVATSYAGAVLGYGNPSVAPRGGGTVDVRDGRSPSSATITLAQTVRRGQGGIWLVTGVARR